MEESLVVALIQAETAKLYASIEGMKAENAWRESCGNSLAYSEDAFCVVADTFDKEVKRLLEQRTVQS